MVAGGERRFSLGAALQALWPVLHTSYTPLKRPAPKPAYEYEEHMQATHFAGKRRRLIRPFACSLSLIRIRSSQQKQGQPRPPLYLRRMYVTLHTDPSRFTRFVPQTEFTQWTFARRERARRTTTHAMEHLCLLAARWRVVDVRRDPQRPFRLRLSASDRAILYSVHKTISLSHYIYNVNS